MAIRPVRVKPEVGTLQEQIVHQQPGHLHCLPSRVAESQKSGYGRGIYTAGAMSIGSGHLAPGEAGYERGIARRVGSEEDVAVWMVHIMTTRKQ